MPRRGYHWVKAEPGDLFVYASKGKATAIVTVESAGGRYGVTSVCGGAFGPPDRAWRPSPPRPPVETTADEQHAQEANRAMFATLPPMPDGRLVSSEPQTTGVRTPVATLFRFEVSTGRCLAMARYVEALAAVGFVGGAMETADGEGSLRVGEYVRGDMLVGVSVRTGAPDVLVTVSTATTTKFVSTTTMACTVD